MSFSCFFHRFFRKIVFDAQSSHYGSLRGLSDDDFIDIIQELVLEMNPRLTVDDQSDIEVSDASSVRTSDLSDADRFHVTSSESDEVF